MSSLKKQKNKTSINLAFCIVQNLRNLFGRSTFSDDLPFLKGYRSVQLFIVLSGHTILTNLYIPTSDPKNTLDAFNSQFKVFAAFLPISAGFFLISSSFLFTTFIWNSFEKGHKINFWMLFVNRYLRIAVPMLFLIIIDKCLVNDLIGTVIQSPVYFPQSNNYLFLPLTHTQNYIWNLTDYVSSIQYVLNCFD